MNPIHISTLLLEPTNPVLLLSSIASIAIIAWVAWALMQGE